MEKEKEIQKKEEIEESVFLYEKALEDDLELNKGNVENLPI